MESNAQPAYSAALPVNALKALLCIAPTRDVRHYLNGICVDFDARRLIATDGHRMLLVNLDSKEPYGMEGSGQVILPAELVAAALKTAGRSQVTLPLTIRHALKEGEPQSFQLGNAIGQTIDGRYPEYARVVPSDVSGETTQLDCQHLAAISKAFGHLGSPYVHIGHNGNGPALIYSVSVPQALAILMPIRSHGDADGGKARVREFLNRSDLPAPDSNTNSENVVTLPQAVGA